MRFEFVGHVIELQAIAFSLKLNEANIQTAERNVNAMKVENNYRSSSKMGGKERGQ
jgi:hypothetical protein